MQKVCMFLIRKKKTKKRDVCTLIPKNGGGIKKAAKMGYKHMAVVWFSGAIKNRKVAIHHGSKLTGRGPVTDTAKSGRQFRAHTPKMGSDQWLFQTSSDADEHAERSALSAISKQTLGEDSGQMDKSIPVQSHDLHEEKALRSAYINGLMMTWNFAIEVITFDYMRLL